MKYEICNYFYTLGSVKYKNCCEYVSKKSLQYVLVQLVRKLLEEKQLIKFVHRKKNNIRRDFWCLNKRFS